MAAPQFRQALLARIMGELFEYEHTLRANLSTQNTKPRKKFRWGYILISARAR